MRRIPRYIMQVSVIIISLCGLASVGLAQFEAVEPVQTAMGGPGKFSESPGHRQERHRFRQNRNEDGNDFRINWRALKLTPEQLEHIKEFRRDFQINTAGIREKLTYAQQDLQEEIGKIDVDQAKIDDALQQLSELKQALNEAAIKNILAMRSVLTPEQLAILTEQRTRMPQELKGLNLSAEQQALIHQIMQDAMKKTRILRIELHDLKMELRDMLLSFEEVEQARLEQVQASITEKEMALETARIDQLLKIRDVLTPEQIEQYQRVRGKRP